MEGLEVSKFINVGMFPSFEVTNIFEKLKSDFDSGRFPWVGSYKDFALGYITFASSLHALVDSVARPVGSFVVGSTSSGKSQFLEAICQLFPEEMIFNLTSVSPKSLIYHCKHDSHYLNGKVVFIEELSALRDEDIQYLLRVLVTKGWARHTTVQGGEVQVFDIVGKISLQSTGLKSDVLRDDTMNRMVIFSSDDSNERTSQVINAIKKRYIDIESDPKRSDSFADYKGFFRDLKPYRVSIPYADRIEVKVSNTENRRLIKIFMDLLTSVTLLNQGRRMLDEESQVLISEEEDFEVLHSLISAEMDSNVDLKLNRSEQAVYEKIIALDGQHQFTVDSLKKERPGFIEGKFAGYGVTTIKNSIKTLLDLDLIRSDKIGKKIHYQLNNCSLGNRWGVVGLSR